MIDAFYRIFDAAGSAVQGIINALSSGDIQLAGEIAMGALQAMFLQALVEIPGMGQLLATGFGQALLAGRWDLAAAIGMANVKLAIVQGWNSIANIWSATLTGLGAIWDMVVYGVRTGWHAASTALSAGILWVVGTMGDAITGLQILFDGMWTSIKTMAVGMKVLFTEGIEAAQEYGRKSGEAFRDRTMKRLRDQAASKAGNQKMLAEDAARMQASINRDFEKNMTGRVSSEQAARERRQQSEEQIKQRIAELNKQATAGGVISPEDAAFKARYELATLTDKARNQANTRGQLAASRVVPGLASNTVCRRSRHVAPSPQLQLWLSVDAVMHRSRQRVTPRWPTNSYELSQTNADQSFPSLLRIQPCLQPLVAITCSLAVALLCTSKSYAVRLVVSRQTSKPIQKSSMSAARLALRWWSQICTRRCSPTRPARSRVCVSTR